MRDPSRSLMSAPSAANSVSISAQRIEPLTGRAKINSSVAL